MYICIRVCVYKILVPGLPRVIVHHTAVQRGRETHIELGIMGSALLPVSC